jgi:hypothetical protein
MTLRLSAFAILLLSMITASCTSTVHMRYAPDTKKVRPVLKTGDTITWEVPIEWIYPDENPCEADRFTASRGKVCKIRSDVKPSIHSYDCNAATPCDPDIAIDDDFRMNDVKTLTAAVAGRSARSADMNVYLRCLREITDIKLPEMKPVVGQTMLWRSTGNTPLIDWKVELQGDNRDKLCAGGTYQFSENHEPCKVQALPAGVTSIEYTVTSSSCRAPVNPGKVTPQ